MINSNQDHRAAVLRIEAKTRYDIDGQLRTLAAKHQCTVSKVAAKRKAVAESPHGQRTCFEPAPNAIAGHHWSHDSAGYPHM
jgi:hypothetical protein